MKDIKQLIDKLTVEEKAALVSGHDFMYTNPVPRLDIPSIRMSDGPHGLRVQNQSKDNGVSPSEIATAFPPACLTACGWNESNLYKMGIAIGEEARYYGINVVLGPGVNIKRNPLAGRNFEYFSEDPLLAGKSAAAEIKGIQSQNVGVSLKHFALNNAENYRFMGDSICDIRAIREIYLKAFEIAVKESKPKTIMCSYNKINGTYCCQNKWLLKDILRTEWNYEGLVMTDWGATHDRIKMLNAGLDLEMPGDTAICRKWIIDGINNQELKISSLNDAVYNVLNLVSKQKQDKEEFVDFKSHDLLAEEIAEDCAVLMKNDGILPLSKENDFLVVGELFEKMRYQGSGSSMINPTSLITPKDAFDNANINYDYCKGYKENRIDVDNSLIDEAINLSKTHDKIIAFIGLTDYVESEGCDRDNMSLPLNQIELINALIKTGKKIIAVLFTGSTVELPFIENIHALLNMYLPGQRGGEATRKLLFGEKCPCGKLSETWVKEYSDVPYHSSFSKSPIEVYKESIYVGYRYYQKINKEVSFPFGFGLSYTSFKYENLNIEIIENQINVSATIHNTGKYYGAEIVQLYVKGVKSDVYKPVKELKGFTKVYLTPDEKKRITINLNSESFSYFNIKENRFVLEKGEYEFQLCSNCEKVELSKTIKIQGEEIKSPYDEETYNLYENKIDDISDEEYQKAHKINIPYLPQKKPITLESRFTDLNETFFGKILFNAVLSVAKKDMKEASKMEEGKEKDNKIKGALFLKRILESNSLITMSMSAGNSFPYNFAMGFVDLSNGHIFKGIKDFCSPIKTSKLPIEDKKEVK